MVSEDMDAKEVVSENIDGANVKYHTRLEPSRNSSEGGPTSRSNQQNSRSSFFGVLARVQELTHAGMSAHLQVSGRGSLRCVPYFFLIG